VTRVGVITSAELHAVHEDEQPLLAAIRAAGCEAVPVVWTAPLVECDAYLMRSPWDWHTRADAFVAFLARLPETRTWNRPSQMRACLGKEYLLALAAAGVSIVPTELVEGDGDDVTAALARREWSRAVVKPVLSASAARTVRVEQGTATLPRDRWLAQPYMPEIEAGELSFVFLDGELSHVVRKMPRAGDFRVQAEHGGTSRREPIDGALAAQAAAALGALGGAPLYARVDGIVRGGSLLVMEIEVVEPQLFFGLCPEAGPRLTAALLGRLRA
jgi:glutathione synthase/RimK-type ligase-like ATP-grasp enzyme